MATRRVRVLQPAIPRASKQAPTALPAVPKPRLNPLMFNESGMRRWALNMSSHGGQCCGMRHLSGFPSVKVSQTHEDRLEFVRDGITRTIQAYTARGRRDNLTDVNGREESWRTCIEVVLTKIQAREWRDSVEECGFKEVFSFRNSNSGNICVVFLLETNV